MLTPDSSRYWDAAVYATGDRTASFDKQIVRNWMKANWDGDRRAPPTLPRGHRGEDGGSLPRAGRSAHCVRIARLAWADPRGEALRVAQRAELTERYGTADSEPGPAPSAADITLFLVAFDGDDAIACGGLRQLDDQHGEIKRMYVVPDRRGSGAASGVLRALEDAARARGWDRLVLETGERQPDAIRFYEREGYTRIPNFGHYADSELSVCFERRLG